MKEIPLTQDKVALVDDQDYEWLNQWKWTYTSRGCTGYAYRNVYQGSRYVRCVFMHRFILNPPPGLETDHINGNGLDNRRCNLRACTHIQNSWNSRKQQGATSQYKGVSWARKNQCWRAFIHQGGQQISLGNFDSEEAAALAYNYAAIKLRGSHTLLNLVPDGPPPSRRLKKRPGKTSRYVGVSWSRQPQGWRAEIRVKGKLIYLGCFTSEDEAARVWNAAALKWRGPGAKQNIVQGERDEFLVERS